MEEKKRKKSSDGPESVGKCVAANLRSPIHLRSVCVCVPLRFPANAPCVRHKLDLAIEEKIFISNDLEDLRAESLRTEQGLRSYIEVRLLL